MPFCVDTLCGLHMLPHLKQMLEVEYFPIVYINASSKSEDSMGRQAADAAAPFAAAAESGGVGGARGPDGEGNYSGGNKEAVFPTSFTQMYLKYVLCMPVVQKYQRQEGYPVHAEMRAMWPYSWRDRGGCVGPFIHSDVHMYMK